MGVNEMYVSLTELQVAISKWSCIRRERKIDTMGVEECPDANETVKTTRTLIHHSYQDACLIPLAPVITPTPLLA